MTDAEKKIGGAGWFQRLLDGRWSHIAVPVFCVLLSLLVSGILLVVLGKDPFVGFYSFLQGSGLAPKGSYGGRFSMWIHSDNPQPYGSFGNGSAMRVSPVAWLFDDLEKVIEEAAETAAPTHNHPEGIKGAMAVAHAIWHFRKSGANGGKGDLQGFIDLANDSYPDFDNSDYPVGVFDETCMEVVPLSFHIIAHASSFEDAIRLAVSHGGDSDTIGAIVGSIAEARFGIPEEIKERAISYMPDDMKAVYQQFEEKINT